MIGLTKMQAECLAIISRHCDAGEPCPSFEELKVELGLKSKSGIYRLLSSLEEKGRIRRLHGRARAIEVVSEDQNALRLIPTKLLRAELLRRRAAA